jgi:hypothetical protein
LGTPADFFEMDDLLTAAQRGYKLYVFLNAFSLSAKERAAIDSLKRDGNVLLFMFTAGIFDPENLGSADLTRTKEVTGFDLEYKPSWCSLEMVPTDEYGELLGALPAGVTLGRFYRPVTTGFTVAPGESQMPPPSTANGYFFVGDLEKNVVPLATYRGTKDVGFALKRFDNWTSVFFGATAIPAVTLRQLLRLAGGHIYLDTDDVVYGNESFLTIYATSPGKKKVVLPKPADVYDMFAERLVTSQSSEFTFDAKVNTTYLFFIGDLGELEKARVAAGKE